MNNNQFSQLHIASDHAGVAFKSKLIPFLQELGYTVTNHGTDTEASCDYPDYVHPLAQEVAANQTHGGILICGSGNGVCITANKYQDIRAALCWNQELASLARQHNNANVICIPARFVDFEITIDMIQVFLNTAFEGGRHQNRVNKISLG